MKTRPGDFLWKSRWLYLVCACAVWHWEPRQVLLLCSWFSLMRYQPQTSIHQPHWWGQRGATASVKRGIMVPRVRIGQPCLQRLLGTEGLKQYTTPASTLLCSTSLSSLSLRAVSLDLVFFSFFFISLIFWNKGPKSTSGIWRPNLCEHVCVNRLKGEAAEAWLIK